MQANTSTVKICDLSNHKRSETASSSPYAFCTGVFSVTPVSLCVFMPIFVWVFILTEASCVVIYGVTFDRLFP
jgi:hypothetical protein